MVGILKYLITDGILFSFLLFTESPLPDSIIACGLYLAIVIFDIL